MPASLALPVFLRGWCHCPGLYLFDRCLMLKWTAYRACTLQVQRSPRIRVPAYHQNGRYRPRLPISKYQRLQRYMGQTTTICSQLVVSCQATPVISTTVPLRPDNIRSGIDLVCAVDLVPGAHDAVYREQRHPHRRTLSQESNSQALAHDPHQHRYYRLSLRRRS